LHLEKEQGGTKREIGIGTGTHRERGAASYLSYLKCQIVQKGGKVGILRQRKVGIPERMTLLHTVHELHTFALDILKIPGMSGFICYLWQDISSKIILALLKTFKVEIVQR